VAKYLIAYQDSRGLRQDASVLSLALRSINCSSEIVEFGFTDTRYLSDYITPFELPANVKLQAPYDYLFLLEHAHTNPPFLDSEFARRRILIPNIEWLNAQDIGAISSGYIDYTFLKNCFSLDQLRRHGVNLKSSRHSVIGWTSIDIADQRELSCKDFNKFLHVRGVSENKQTETLMETWADNPDFPELTIVMRFRISFSLKRPLQYGNNVTVLLREMPDDPLRQLQNSIGIHICPSAAEGFGHTLNEARSTSSVLITTQAPPMRDLVIADANGLLVPTVIPPEPLNLSERHLVGSEDLAKVVRRLLSIPLEDRVQMGRRSREMYEHDKEDFFARLVLALKNMA
jgi:glycosyltransferase involved in cell wall biosynthesis